MFIAYEVHRQWFCSLLNGDRSFSDWNLDQALQLYWCFFHYLYHCCLHWGWLPNFVILVGPTKLRLRQRVPVHITTIGAKFLYLGAHLGERALESIGTKKKRESAMLESGRASQKRSQVWLSFSKLDTDNTRCSARKLKCKAGERV